MKSTPENSKQGRPRPASRMPDSVFFEKIVPILLVCMGILTLGLIIIAAGVLLGFVNF